MTGAEKVPTLVFGGFFTGNCESRTVQKKCSRQVFGSQICRTTVKKRRVENRGLNHVKGLSQDRDNLVSI